jgi:hypothetical protein
MNYAASPKGDLISSLPRQGSEAISIRTSVTDNTVSLTVNGCYLG